MALALALIWGGLRAGALRPRARSPEMTREDLALLRTARDALAMLTRRQIARVFGGAEKTWPREKERLP
ncbi:hypothetical protein AAU61_00740 [Desulfocarbo indianensis]|nr:hypothetical protein AAU61_00740 [Desulfocarbo indianensis]